MQSIRVLVALLLCVFTTAQTRAQLVVRQKKATSVTSSSPKSGGGKKESGTSSKTRTTTTSSASSKKTSLPSRVGQTSVRKSTSTSTSSSRRRGSSGNSQRNRTPKAEYYEMIELENGAYYSGYVLNNMLEGEGRIIYDDSTYIEGKFHEGRLTGEATYKCGKRNYRSSDWSDFPKGSGVSWYDDVDMFYVGAWDEDMDFIGQGKYLNTKGETYFEGEFWNNQPYGYGKWYFGEEADGLFKGAFYTGQLVNGVFCGEGTFQTPYGIQYHGQFWDDKPNGIGTLTIVRTEDRERITSTYYGRFNGYDFNGAGFMEAGVCYTNSYGTVYSDTPGQVVKYTGSWGGLGTQGLMFGLGSYNVSGSYKNTTYEKNLKSDTGLKLVKKIGKLTPIAKADMQKAFKDEQSLYYPDPTQSFWSQGDCLCLVSRVELRDDRTIVYQKFRSETPGVSLYSMGTECLIGSNGKRYKIMSSSIGFDTKGTVFNDTDWHEYTEVYPPLDAGVTMISIYDGHEVRVKDLRVTPFADYYKHIK